METNFCSTAITITVLAAAVSDLRSEHDGLKFGGVDAEMAALASLRILESLFGVGKYGHPQRVYPKLSAPFSPDPRYSRYAPTLVFPVISKYNNSEHSDSETNEPLYPLYSYYVWGETRYDLNGQSLMSFDEAQCASFEDLSPMIKAQLRANTLMDNDLFEFFTDDIIQYFFLSEGGLGLARLLAHKHLCDGRNGETLHKKAIRALEKIRPDQNELAIIDQLLMALESNPHRVDRIAEPIAKLLANRIKNYIETLKEPKAVQDLQKKLDKASYHKNEQVRAILAPLVSQERLETLICDKYFIVRKAALNAINKSATQTQPLTHQILEINGDICPTCGGTGKINTHKPKIRPAI